MTRVNKIVDYPEWDQTGYFSTGTLTIGDSRWNVEAFYNKANDNSTAELHVGSYGPS